MARRRGVVVVLAWKTRRGYNVVGSGRGLSFGEPGAVQMLGALGAFEVGAGAVKASGGLWR